MYNKLLWTVFCTLAKRYIKALQIPTDKSLSLFQPFIIRKTMNYWEGKKIRLRGIEPEDYEHFYQWNLETETARNLAWLWFPTSRESQRAWAAAESLKKGINDEYFFVIETLSGEFVGSIHSNTVSRIDGSFRYGIGIVERARGQCFA